MSETILVVDDEQRIIDLAQMYLEQEGYRVTSATDGTVAFQKILSEKPEIRRTQTPSVAVKPSSFHLGLSSLHL